MLSFWSYALSPKMKALPPSTPAPPREDTMLPDIKDASNQILVKNLLGTTKSQLRQNLSRYRKKLDS